MREWFWALVAEWIVLLLRFVLSGCLCGHCLCDCVPYSGYIGHNGYKAVVYTNYAALASFPAH